MKKELLYFCKVVLGKGRDRPVFWCKSIDWINDQIVLSFSDQSCSVPFDAYLAFQRALSAVDHPRFKSFSMSCEIDPASKRFADYSALGDSVNRFIATYGLVAFNELINQLPASEVTPDA